MYVNLKMFLDISCVLQIMILSMLPAHLGTPRSELEKNIIRIVFLFQYIPKLYRLLPLLAGQTPTGFIFESAWANFIINLLTFILAGHAIGSFWYIAGLQVYILVITTLCSVFTTPSVFIDYSHVCIVFFCFFSFLYSFLLFRELRNACYMLGIIQWMNVEIL